MKATKIYQKFTSFIVMCLFILGCAEETLYVAVDSVQLDQESMLLMEGEVQALTATVTPSNADNKNVIWHSSDYSVATVRDGHVAALKAGVADIKAMSVDGDKYDVCKVTVWARKNLSSSGTANCYIVSDVGSYEFAPVKGNRDELVGAIKSADILWESFGTDTAPNVGDLIVNVRYENGVIRFETPQNFKRGNAVIAAKDAAGEILWSWHIWLTDMPQKQVYYNNAGTMMDRNLGATTQTPGLSGSLGLFYQWGRKDPFLGSHSCHTSTVSTDIAKSTITWPPYVESTSSTGTIEYATANPTTFITNNSNNMDWYYDAKHQTDDTRWLTSASPKSIYDPCPVGWRVPDGGDNGVWFKAVGSHYRNDYKFDYANAGMNLSGQFGDTAIIWYPASGYINYYYMDISSTGLYFVGEVGCYWSASTDFYRAHSLYVGTNVELSHFDYRANAFSVRCIQSID